MGSMTKNTDNQLDYDLVWTMAPFTFLCALIILTQRSSDVTIIEIAIV